MEVTEARSADGHFTVVAEEEDYELATVDEEHEDAKELDNQKGIFVGSLSSKRLGASRIMKII